TRQSPYYNQILSIIKADYTLPENGVQPGREGGGYIRSGYRITISSEAGKLFHNAQLFDIPGDGSLGTPEALRLQSGQKLLLGFNIVGGNDLQNFCLPLTFHSLTPNQS